MNLHDQQLIVFLDRGSTQDFLLKSSHVMQMGVVIILVLVEIGFEMGLV